MSAERTWKPGDVATEGSEVVVFTDEHIWLWATTGEPCVYQERITARARPLVVIDPADREQVERLMKLYDEQPFDCDDGGSIREMQGALREFANPKPPKPPKPEEPTGLGAVVEAINDNFFVRVSTGDHPWQRVSDVDGEYLCAWQDIDVVKVLSEGIER